MNIITIQSCDDFFLENYLKTFQLVITYNSNSFILIGEPIFHSTATNKIDILPPDLNTCY